MYNRVYICAIVHAIQVDAQQNDRIECIHLFVVKFINANFEVKIGIIIFR